jgi:hypothetical protein
MLDTQHVFTEVTLDTAYSWLCKQRRNFPANADIWHLRFHWHTTRANLLFARESAYSEIRRAFWSGFFLQKCQAQNYIESLENHC